jgi:hypothetical protein
VVELKAQWLIVFYKQKNGKKKFKLWLFLKFIVQYCQYLYYIVSCARLTDEWWILKHEHGCNCGTVEVLSQHLPGRTEETQEAVRLDVSQTRFKMSTSWTKSKELFLYQTFLYLEEGDWSDRTWQQEQVKMETPEGERGCFNSELYNLHSH